MWHQFFLFLELWDKGEPSTASDHSKVPQKIYGQRKVNKKEICLICLPNFTQTQFITLLLKKSTAFDFDANPNQSWEYLHFRSIDHDIHWGHF